MEGAVYIHVPIEVALRCARGMQTREDKQLLWEKLRAAKKRSDKATAVLESLVP